MKRLIVLPLALLCYFGSQAQQQPPQKYDPIIVLRLPLSQVNLILSSLTEKKLGDALDTYVSIRTQAIPQLQIPDSTNPKPVPVLPKIDVKKLNPEDIKPKQ